MEEYKRLTSTRTSDQEITYYLDLSSAGMRISCIVLEIIMLVFFIPLFSLIPITGKGIFLIVMLYAIFPTPLSILLVRGVITSTTRKEITVNRSTSMLMLTVKRAGMSNKRDIPFEDIMAILLESESVGPPPGVKANGREAWVELVFILANGVRESIVKGVTKKIQPSDVQWLKNELTAQILIGKEKPVVFYSERVKIVKSPGIDGETIIEISKARRADLTVAILFAILFAYFAGIFFLLGYVLDLDFIGWIGLAVAFPVFGLISIGSGITYGVKLNARDHIIVNENTSFLLLESKSGKNDVRIQINDIVKLLITIQRTITRQRVYYSYYPTFKMIDGRDLRLYKSDRFMEVANLNNLLVVIIAHARRKQQDPDLPPLPLLTYDALYKKRTPEESQLLETREDEGKGQPEPTSRPRASPVFTSPEYDKGPGRPFSLYCQSCDSWMKMDGDYVIAGDETCKKCGEPMRFMLQCAECGHATFHFVNDYRTITKSAMTCTECGAKMVLK